MIVVSFDALRADALGVYGYERRTSPHIDAFAAESLVFENAYSVTADTPTSFAAFFSGRYPTRSFRNWFLTEEDTLAALFAHAGYATAGFMHNAHLSPTRGFDHGFQVYEVFDELGGDSDAVVLGRARDWIESRGDEPFFVWIHLIDPHSPWERRPESEHLYDPTYRGPSEQAGGTAFTIDDPVELVRLRTLYDGEIFASDARFGGFLEALRTRGLLDTSILVLTSDHGEEFMQHGWLQHGQLNEENLRIPLILHHPDQGKGARTGVVVSQLDLMPTLASLARISVNADLDGRDLRRIGRDADPLLAVAYTSPQFRQASLRRGKRKLIVECGPRVRSGKQAALQLYDLESDPKESINLAAVQPDAAYFLSLDLWAALGMRGCEDLKMRLPDEPDREFEGLDEAAIRQLEALGYRTR